MPKSHEVAAKLYKVAEDQGYYIPANVLALMAAVVVEELTPKPSTVSPYGLQKISTREYFPTYKGPILDPVIIDSIWRSLETKLCLYAFDNKLSIVTVPVRQMSAHYDPSLKDCTVSALAEPYKVTVDKCQFY